MRDKELQTSALKLVVKNCVDYAGVTAQLAIALLSVAALTKKRAAFYVAALFAGFAIAVLITGYALGFQYLQGHFVQLWGFF